MSDKTDATKQSDWDSFWAADKVHKKLSWSKRRILAILDRYLKPQMSVLDAGCGSGFFSKYFISKDARTCALDYSSEALAVARQMTEDRAEAYLQADLLEEDWVQDHAGRYDIIFSDGLFEHFNRDQQDRIFRNLCTCLAEGGRIITFVPNKWSFWQVIRPLLMPGIKEAPFTLKRLRELYTRNGTDISQSGGINVLPCGISPEWVGSTFGMLLYAVGPKS